MKNEAFRIENYFLGVYCIGTILRILAKPSVISCIGIQLTTFLVSLWFSVVLWLFCIVSVVICSVCDDVPFSGPDEIMKLLDNGTGSRSRAEPDDGSGSTTCDL